ncbi:nitrate- and nitrite sensing domain-containing protein [Streptomyces tubbatahanensis]|uniref:histidine kinase n=1 Tax=Streptomyces tubbatahanensis TaxID=2923272 RepID=A0ABY3XWU9_9ACTN|nr:nitrate- and nitrite sensing domain-containing protein [Streptomyces tubbatahanensis]UNS98955.1 nitrate- and nitrite sensing domain-containing protein [Streptomyces tubbatahanensis]
MPPAQAQEVVAAPRRRARVRNRLLVSVAVCALAVVAAGAPSLVAGSSDTAAAQELVDLARLNQQAIALSHSLEDERDGMVEHLAAGRGSRQGTGAGDAQRARVDRQAREVRSAASSAPSGSAVPSGSPTAVAEALKKLPAVRQQAMTGKKGALESYEDYSRVIQTLRHLTRDVAGGLPARAQDRTAVALPDLARAVDQASATRGLLEAALAGRGTQREVMAEAGQARLREKAALADFEETAGTKAWERYTTTVNGPDVSAAERYLNSLTARPYLTPGARSVNEERFDTSVSARLAHMRGVQSAFAAAEVKRLEGLRDDDVTALQLRAGLVGFCLLLAVALSVATARSLTRPLSVLRRGSTRLAKDPVGEEPITFRGRNDEFADVVGALNALRATTAELRRRSACAEREQDQLAVEKAQLTEKYQLLAEDFAALRAELEEARERSGGAVAHSGGLNGASGAGYEGMVPAAAAVTSETAPSGTVSEGAVPSETALPVTASSATGQEAVADLATRSLTLVERQLGIIEGLEEKEADPDRLDTLFKLDHLATRMRRHSENLLLLADSPRSQRQDAAEQLPAPLLDVVRAAVSEIAQYERVALGDVPQDVHVEGVAADALSHLVAELLDNAAAFSPAGSEVRLTALTTEAGDALVSVEDEGAGMEESVLAQVNARLAEPQTAQAPGSSGAWETSAPWGLGLHVVAKLAARHGVRVRLSALEEGGTAARVTVASRLLLNGTLDDAGVAGGSGPADPAAAGDIVASDDGGDGGPALGAPTTGGLRDHDADDGHSADGGAVDGGTDAGGAGGGEAGGSYVQADGDGGAGSTEGDDAGEGQHARAADQAPTRALETSPSAQDDEGTRATQVPRSEGEDGGRSAGLPEGPAVAPAQVPPAGEPEGSLPTGAAAGTPAGAAEPDGSVTHTGLPKRVRGATAEEATAEDAAAPRQRSGGADPEQLRRRLDGFQQGARKGLREAAARVAAESAGDTASSEGAEGDRERAGDGNGRPEGSAATEPARPQADGGSAEEARK